MTAPRRALVNAPLLPEFDRESGSRRIYDLVMFLKELGWSVSFIAQNASQGDRYVHHLQQAGIATYCGFGKETEALYASGGLDVAIVAFWHLAEQQLPLLRRLSPRTRIIIDSIDLHFVRNARRILQTSFGCEGGTLDAAYGDEFIREMNIYAAADGVLTVSAKEAGLINDLTGDPDLALVVPDCEELAPSPHGFDERRGMLFVGNFRHPPNVDAVGYLCREVLPLVDARMLAEHPLYIVGNGLPERVHRYAAELANVKIVGWVPSLLPYIERSRISVIPLLYGAGTKRKLLQALMIGTPTVSTSIGVEGIGLVDREQALIADSPLKFAAAIEELLVDRGLWEAIARTGREWIMPRHGRQAARERMRCALEIVLAKPVKRLREELPPGEDSRAAYVKLAGQICRETARLVPAGSTLAVISKGDRQLVDMAPNVGWHFPQSDDGQFAGYHPADDAEAIEHLEALRAKGAQYLVVPDCYSWWLTHYQGFRAHLESKYSLLYAEPGVAAWYALEPVPTTAVGLSTDPEGRLIVAQ